MFSKNQFVRFISLGAMALSLSITGCAEKKMTVAKKPAVESPKAGFLLKYNIKQGQSLNYKRSSESTQSMEMMGQAMKTTSKISTDYIIKGAGTNEQNNIMAQVTINDLAINVNSPQGPVNPDTSGLKGKSFKATYSPNGKEIEAIGFDDLPKISMGQPMAQPQSAKTYFSNLLPLLPDNDLKIGDTWTTPIDEKRKQGPIELNVKGETASVLDGLETIQGMDCVRIKSETKSTVDGAGSAGGQNIKISGDIKATSISFFAYKEGIFVKGTVDQESTMKLNLGAMGEMPQTTKAKSTIELVQ